MFTRVKVEVPVEQQYLNIIHNSIKESSRLLGLGNKVSMNLQLAAEEVFSSICKNRSEESQKGSEEEKVSVVISKNAGLINIEINYSGLPLNLSFDDKYNAANPASADAAGLETFLIKNSVDFFTFKNLGPRGYQFILQKNLFDERITGAEDTIPASIGDDETVAFYKLTETDEEVYGVVKLIYHTYGSSYRYEDFYYPERVKSLIKDGHLYSVIAVTNKGKIAGHGAMVIHTPGSPVAEFGIAVTNPQCRGKGIQKNIITERLKLAREKGLSGIYTQAVTAHPYSERNVQSFGMKETALMLGIAPATVSFKGISETLKQRESFCVHYLPLNPTQTEKVKLYTWHGYEEIIRSIYNYSIPGEISFCRSDEKKDEGQTIISSSINALMNNAVINLELAGTDFEHSFKNELKRLQMQRVDVIYLALDLEKPLSDDFYNYFFKNEFFFAGVFPWHPFRHTLMLQKLNNYEMDLERVCTVSPMGDAIKKFVKADQERVS